MIISGIKEIDYQTAEEQGIDTSMISVCKKLRNLAKLDRLKIDEDEHRSGLNKHLFNYICYCGLEPKEYIRSYLSHLQPYMLERRKDQEKKDSFVCVIDNMYKISLYIKADTKQFDEVIVSFHENNIRGIAKSNDRSGKVIQKHPRLVPIFAESIGSINQENNHCSVNVIMQRGMKELPLSIVGIKCKDVFIVKEQDISNQFLDYCNEYIQDLYTSNLNLDFDKIEVFSMLQQIFFTSYGKDTFSSLSLLIDSLTAQGDAISKSTADFALITFAQNLSLTTEQAEELEQLLSEKYMVTSIKGIQDILRRVKFALSSDNAKEDALDKLSELAVECKKTESPVQE